MFFIFVNAKKNFFWGQSLLFIYCMCALHGCPQRSEENVRIPEVDITSRCEFLAISHFEPWSFSVVFNCISENSAMIASYFSDFQSPFSVPSVYSEGVSYFSSSLWLQSRLFSPHWQKSIVAMFKDKLPELVCQRLFSLC